MGLAVMGLVGDGGLLAFDTQGPRMLNAVQYPPQSHTVKYRFTPKAASQMNTNLLSSPHLTDGETEAQRGKVTCPRQHSHKRHKAGEPEL